MVGSAPFSISIWRESSCDDIQTCIVCRLSKNRGMLLAGSFLDTCPKIKYVYSLER